MTWSLRRVRLILGAGALLGCAALVHQAYGQRVAIKRAAPVMIAPVPGKAGVPAPAPDDGRPRDAFDYSGVNLPKDEKGYKNKIQAAIDYTQEKDWKTAVRALQELVDIKEDVFVQLPHKTPDGKESLRLASVKTEANRLIGSLPKEGLEFYKLTYGAEALALLKDAKAKGDPALLGQVIKRFTHTDAGQEALVLLAGYDLDRGNYVAASLRFEKLRSREGADKLPAAVLFRMAYAASVAGDKEAEKWAWTALRNQGREVVLGKESRTVGELQEYIAQVARGSYVNDSSESRLFRGTPARTNQLVGGPAFLEPRWKQPMIYADGENGDTARWLRKAELHLKNRGQLVLPAYFPITATVTKGEQRIPLLIFKTYWGLQAVDMKTGKLAWNSPSSWSLERMLDKRADARKVQAIGNWLNFYVEQNQRPQIIFENSTVGTLSTDNQFVYVVEDFAVPPPQQNVMAIPGMMPPGTGNAGYTQDINEAIHHSRLQAFSLLTNGKLVWEVGGFGEKDNPLSDCFFLGPPLPLGGKLYVLTEKQEELRLVCLDPQANGKVVYQQILGTTKEKLEGDVNRRSHAAHLAYGEGILVVPTNAGMVFGIDLLENRLVWAYPYREASDASAMEQTTALGFRGRIPPGWVMGPDGRLIHQTPPQGQWKVSAPVIQDGKVVFTAPDARSIHCINLRDGSAVWKKSRSEDDLFFGGSYNGKVVIVSKKRARGLGLANGETLWELDTGVPSGQGIASGNVYYLPLLESAQSKDPEICAIDVDRGAIAARTRSRAKEVPGNLLFFEGDVVSQTANEVVAYPQLKVKIAQMDELIAKNPKDPTGLTERGTLRLDQGDLPGAIDDLRSALRNDPATDVRARARAKLYDALTDYVQRDFSAAEEYLKEYEALCKVEPEPDSGDEGRTKAEKEERKRRANFLYLVAKGREKQGRLVEAFEKYQQYGETAGTEELRPLLDEPSVKANPDVWARGRIAAMVAKASAEERRPLEALIASRWDKLQQSTTELNDLRRFVRLFGPLSDVGREARFHLADRLIEEGEATALLEAEKELNSLRTPREAPETAARAVEALGRLYTRRGLLEDAAYCYRLLGRDYAKVKVRDGKTGSDFYDDAATDKRLMPHLDEPRLGPTRPLKVVEEPGAPLQTQVYHFERIGEPLPFFARHTLGLNFSTHHLEMVDRRNPDAVWSPQLTRTMFQAIVQNHGQPNAARFPYRTQGHLVVLPVGHLVYGIDPVNRQVLWEHNLTGTTAGSNPGQGPTWQNLSVDPKDGSILILYNDGWSQRLGQAGPLEGSVLCLQTSEGLEALDPLTGKTLWRRSDVSRHTSLFADDEYVYVVETNADGAQNGSRVLRATDGVTVKDVKPFGELYQKRVGMSGRRLLVADTGPAGVTLRLYDVLTGKDTWTKTFPPRTVVLHSEDPHLGGVVEPDGRVLVIDLASQKEVLSTDKGYDFTNPRTGMDPAHLANLQGITLLADGKQVYLACNGPQDPNLARFGGVQPNLHPGLGMRSVPVNGHLYAFDRETGAFRWQYLVPNQMVVLDHFRDLPILLFTSRYTKWQNLGGRANVSQVAAVQSMDKRTGKFLYDNKDLHNIPNFHALKIDGRTGRIEFTSFNKTIVHQPADEAAKEGAGSGPMPGTGSRSGAAPLRRVSPAVEVQIDR